VRHWQSPVFQKQK